jgi:MFS family permease
VGVVYREPALRRVALGWAGFHLSEWLHVVPLLVLAYAHGGATTVGVVTILRQLPAAFLVPLGTLLADRYPRERVLLGLHVLRGVAMAVAAAALFAGGSLVFVYAGAVAAGLAWSSFRPSHWALLPFLARDPEELVAANATSSSLENAATVVGPLAAGVILAVGSPAYAFAVAAAVSFVAAALMRLVRPPRSVQHPTHLHVWREALGGFEVVARRHDPRLVVGIFAIQTLVRGLLAVLIAIIPISLLGLGGAGVGYLNAALGAGGVVGAYLAFRYVGGRRLARTIAAALLLWGAPIALIGVWPRVGVAFVCVALVGIGKSALDLAGQTMLQRTVEHEIYSRVFGVRECLALATAGIAGVIVPPLVHAYGLRATLVVAGLILPAVAVVTYRRLLSLETRVHIPAREYRALAAVSLFSSLPPPVLERLAASVVAVRLRAGDVVIRQDDLADRFYVVVAGEADVTRDGVHVARAGPGGFFGEIALLRDVPRTATVRAATEMELYALDREPFVTALAGDESGIADDVVEGRLAGLAAAQTTA